MLNFTAFRYPLEIWLKNGKKNLNTNSCGMTGFRKECWVWNQLVIPNKYGKENAKLRWGILFHISMNLKVLFLAQLCCFDLWDLVKSSCKISAHCWMGPKMPPLSHRFCAENSVHVAPVVQDVCRVTDSANAENYCKWWIQILPTGKIPRWSLNRVEVLTKVRPS